MEVWFSSRVYVCDSPHRPRAREGSRGSSSPRDTGIVFISFSLHTHSCVPPVGCIRDGSSSATAPAAVLTPPSPCIVAGWLS